MTPCFLLQNLIETLEMQVLGCWKAALLPAAQDPLLAEEAARLCAQLQQCGWWGKDPTLLKVRSSRGLGLGWEVGFHPLSHLSLAAGGAERRCPPQPC